MTEETAPPSQRARARALANERRTKSFERREAVFDLFVSGFSHQQIATALKISSHAVRRIVDTAVAERRLDGVERFARVQVARLSKALSHADHGLEQGDMKAFAPYLKILAALDRYHGLEARTPSLRPPAIADFMPAPPLALPPAALSEDSAEAAEFRRLKCRSPTRSIPRPPVRRGVAGSIGSRGSAGPISVDPSASCAARTAATSPASRDARLRTSRAKSPSGRSTRSPGDR